MKKKNLYYYTVFQRSNLVKATILGIFLGICSWPRIFIENFTRRSMGERYFLFPLCIFLAALLSIFPFISLDYGETYLGVIGKNFTWYAYLAAFVYVSFKRHQEVKREPGAYDFEKFSLSAGIIHPWFRSLRILGIKPTNKILAIYYEPGVFLIAGVILALLKQNIGYILIVSSIIYGFSWAAQYYLGDQFILDTIDKMICNEELVQSFVHNKEPEHTKGFEAYGRRPNNKEFRRKVAENMIDDEPAIDVY